MGRSPDEIQAILQRCLERIHNGDGTIESVLAEFPKLAEELRQELEMVLWMQERSRQLDPRPEFLSSSRRRLVARLRKETQPQFTLNPSFMWKSLPAELWRAHFVPLAVTLVLLVSVFIGVNAVIPMTDISLPGDKLYPVKITQERVALAISGDESKSAALSVEFTRRRFMEIYELINYGRFKAIDETAHNLEEQVERIIKSLSVDSQREAAETKLLAHSFQELLTEHNRYMVGLLDTAPEEARPGIRKVIHTSTQAMIAIQDLTQDQPTPGPITTSPPILLPTLTPTYTQTSMPSPTLTFTPINTPTPAPTSTPQPLTPSPTNTLSPSPTRTPSPQPAETEAPAQPPTETLLPASTPSTTPSLTPTQTPTPSASASATPSSASTTTPTPGLNDDGEP